MNTFYSEEELKQLGIAEYGEDVHIGRHAVLYHPEQLHIGSHVRIDDFTIISGRVMLRDYIHISHFCGLYGAEKGIELSDYTCLSSRVSVYATSDDYSGETMTNPMVPFPYHCRHIEGAVRIEKHGLVGCGSVILPGVVLREGCSVGSMSLIRESTEEYGIYAGIPARRIRERSRKLKELEQELRAAVNAGKPCRQTEDRH